MNLIPTAWVESMDGTRRRLMIADDIGLTYRQCLRLRMKTTDLLDAVGWPDLTFDEGIQYLRAAAGGGR